MPRTYDSKLDLINNEEGLILVEQPHGLTAYGHSERRPKKVVDGRGAESHDLLMMDAMTMNVIKQIANGLGEKHRETYLSWSWCVIGRKGWELASKCRKEGT